MFVIKETAVKTEIDPLLVDVDSGVGHSTSKPPAVKAAEPIDRFMAAYEPALYEALRKHPDEFSYTAAEVPDFLPRWRNTLLTKDFNHDGYAMRGACKRLGIKCTKQALLAFLRPGAAAVPQVPAGMREWIANGNRPSVDPTSASTAPTTSEDAG